MLLERNSSEDLLYALFFMIHGLGIAELDLVKCTVNPTWEKGPVRNAAEFASMCSKCARKIQPRSVVVRARARGVNHGGVNTRTGRHGVAGARTRSCPHSLTRRPRRAPGWG